MQGRRCPPVQPRIAVMDTHGDEKTVAVGNRRYTMLEGEECVAAIINRHKPCLPLRINAYSAGMYFSTMVFTVPSAISSASAALKASKTSLSFANAIA